MPDTKPLKRHCPYCTFEHFIVHQECVNAVIARLERDLTDSSEAELKELKYKIVVLPNGEMVSVVWLKRHLLGPKEDKRNR